MKYLVDVKDISYGTVEVEAESKEQAEEIAQDNNIIKAAFLLNVDALTLIKQSEN